MKQFVFSYSTKSNDLKIIERFLTLARIYEKNKDISLWTRENLVGAGSKDTEAGKFADADIIVLFTSIDYYSEFDSEFTAPHIDLALKYHYDGRAKVIQVKLVNSYNFKLDQASIIHLPEKGSVLSAGTELIDETCANIFTELLKISGIVSTPSEKSIAQKTISSCSGVRYLLDHHLPGLHRFLTNQLGLFKKNKEELYDIKRYYAVVKEKIRRDIRQKTYVMLEGWIPENDGGAEDFKKPDDFSSSITTEIRYLFGKARGGDAENAQIAAKSKKNKLISNISSAFLRSKIPMILLGEPGGGKTMTIQHAILKIINDGEKRVYPVIPVYVRLGEFEPAQFTPGAVEQLIERNAENEIKPYLSDLLKSNKRLIIFFDGMDEMSRRNYTEKIRLLGSYADGQKDYCQCLFSCRINDFSSAFEYQRLVILPMEKNKIRKFLIAHRVKLPVVINGETMNLQKLVRKLSGGDLPMEASNPFILWLFCNFIRKEQRWPVSRVELIQSYIEEIYLLKKSGQSLQQSRLPDDIRPIFEDWGQFAYLLTTENAGTSIPIALLREKLPAQSNMYDFIAAGKLCGILRESRDETGLLLKFEHQRFQEYFSAYYIFHRKIAVDWLNKLHIPRWQETLLNFILISNETASVKIFATLIDTEFEEFKKDYIPVAEKNSNEATDEDVYKSRYIGETEPPVEQNFFRYSHLTPEERILMSEKETLLTDKIELGSRLMKQLGTDSDLKRELLPSLTKALYGLAEHGNPVSQGKILAASQNMINDIDRLEVTRHTLKSPISWIKSQSIVLSTRNFTSGENISDLATEIGLGCIRFDLLKNLRFFYELEKGAGFSSSRRYLATGLFFFLLKFLLIIGTAYSIYYLSAYVINLKNQWFLIRYELGYGAIIFFALVSAYIQRREDTWMIVAITGISSILVTLLILIVVYEKAGLGMLLSALVFYLLIQGIIPLMALLFSSTERLLAKAFLIFTSGLKKSKKTYSTLSGAVSEVYKTKAKYGTDFSNTIAMTVFILFITLIGFLTGRIPKIKWFHETGRMLKSKTEVILHTIGLENSLLNALSLVVLLLSSAVVLIYYIYSKNRIKKNPWESSPEALQGLILVPVFAMVMLVFGYLEKYGRKFAGPVSILTLVIILLIVIIFFLYFLKLFINKFRARKKKKFAASHFTAYAWKETVLLTSDQDELAAFIEGTDCYSIGLRSNKDFLKVLIEVEPVISPESPAYEIYWTKRKKLEDEIKQERIN